MIFYSGVNPVEEHLFIQPTINLAKSAGELKLASTDPTMQPNLDYRLFNHPFDLARQREAVRLACTFVQHHDFEGILDSPIHPLPENLSSDAALDAYILQAAYTGHHVVGTCKMGPSTDPMAVVNQFGLVHGLEGLRVIDGSIMPDCVRANTNVTIMMIAEKMADAI